MNNFLNISSQIPAASGTAAAGTLAADTGDAGAFAQLMGSLLPQPPATAAPDGAAAGTPAPAAVTDGASPGLPAEAAREPGEQGMDAAITQSDAALIAALLGQLQMPYQAPPPPPPPARPGDEAAPAATAASTPVLSAADALPSAAEVAAAADALQHGEVAAAVPGARPPAADSDVTAVPAAEIALESPAQADQDRRGSTAAAKTMVPAPTATHDLKTAARPATDSPAPAARDLPLSPAAAAAAMAAANPRAALPGEAAAPTTATGGEGAKRAAPSHNDSSAGDGIARPATPPDHAAFRRLLDVQPAADDREFPAAAAAVQAAAGRGTRALRGGTFQESADRIGDFATAAAGMPAALVTRSEGAASQFTLAPHVQAPEWQPAFAGNVKLMLKEGTSSATLQLNPAEFGPIDVRIAVTDQRADIAFLVTHPEANAAIQSALSELREQLAQSGIQLGHTSVGAHSQQAPHSRPGAEFARRGKSAEPAVPTPAETASPARPRGNGSIDIYA